MSAIMTLFVSKNNNPRKHHLDFLDIENAILTRHIN